VQRSVSEPSAGRYPLKANEGAEAGVAVPLIGYGAGFVGRPGERY
jgi:hypothetical protein